MDQRAKEAFPHSCHDALQGEAMPARVDGGGVAEAAPSTLVARIHGSTSVGGGGGCGGVVVVVALAAAVDDVLVAVESRLARKRAFLGIVPSP